MTLAQAWDNTNLGVRQQQLLGFMHGMAKADYIDLVRAPGYGVYASRGYNYQFAVFGRDSIEVGEDLLYTHPDLVREIILTMASLQGVSNHPVSEEAPGLIHHEFRNRYFNSSEIPSASLAIMRDLQTRWGGKGTDELCYYGAVDSTPLFIRLICRYVKQYGPGILEDTYVTRPIFPEQSEKERSRSVRHALYAANAWLCRAIESSPWKLLEFSHLNRDPAWHTETWKDSPTAYMHLDGTPANLNGGIASAEVQGYTYDALTGVAELLVYDGAPNQARDLINLAKTVQQNTLERLWMPEQSYFAQGLDRDEHGGSRQIATLSSNGGLLLDSNLLKDIQSPQQRIEVVEGTVRTIWSDEFLTDAGIRCRARRHLDLFPEPEYHGPHAVWKKETRDIKQGLLNHGYAGLGHELGNRILSSTYRTGGFYELEFADADKVYYDASQAMEYFDTFFGKRPPMPEKDQAWSISATIEEVNLQRHRQLGYFSELEVNLLASTNRVLLPMYQEGYDGETESEFAPAPI